jgi:hypothetical protein
MARWDCVLSNVNPEQHVIGVRVTPPEVSLLLDTPGSAELPIIVVSFPQVDAVGTIFLVVVHVIVAAVPIVIPPVVVIVCRR